MRRFFSILVGGLLVLSTVGRAELLILGNEITGSPVVTLDSDSERGRSQDIHQNEISVPEMHVSRCSWSDRMPPYALEIQTGLLLRSLTPEKRDFFKGFIPRVARLSIDAQVGMTLFVQMHLIHEDETFQAKKALESTPSTTTVQLKPGKSMMDVYCGYNPVQPGGKSPQRGIVRIWEQDESGKKSVPCDIEVVFAKPNELFLSMQGNLGIPFLLKSNGFIDSKKIPEIDYSANINSDQWQQIHTRAELIKLLKGNCLESVMLLAGQYVSRSIPVAIALFPKGKDSLAGGSHAMIAFRKAGTPLSVTDLFRMLSGVDAGSNIVKKFTFLEATETLRSGDINKAVKSAESVIKETAESGDRIVIIPIQEWESFFQDGEIVPNQ